MLPGLRTLLAPLDLKRFRDQYWQKQCYVARANRELVRKLAKELEDFDIHKLLERHSGAVQAWFKTEGGAFRSAEITATAAHAAYDAGVTLYLHQLEVPSVVQWQMRLARELAHSQKDVTCSVFAAKRGAETRCHFDSLENFTIQLRGRKIWHVSPNRHVGSPLENWVTGTAVPDEMNLYCEPPLPRDMPRPRKTVELRPGDILYVPRGHWHSAEASADSFSLFLGLPVTPCVDLVLSAIRSRLLRNASWRENFIDASAGREWENRARLQMAGLLRILEAEVTELTADDIIAACPGAGALRDSTLFQRNPIATLQIRSPYSKSMAETVVIVHRGRFSSERRLTVGRRLVPLCRWLGRQRVPFRMAEAALRARSLPKESVRNLLKNFCQCGFLSCPPGVRATTSRGVSR